MGIDYLYSLNNFLISKLLWPFKLLVIVQLLTDMYDSVLSSVGNLCLVKLSVLQHTREHIEIWRCMWHSDALGGSRVLWAVNDKVGEDSRGNFPDLDIPGSESYDNNPVTALCVLTWETYCPENRAQWLDCVITVSNTHV